MRKDLKAVSLTWLSKTGLTNLNSGEGGSQLVDIKRYRWRGKEYPYVSGQAMRFYLKEAIRREVPPSKACVPDEKGETCGDAANCVLCDLFGYMGVIERGARGERGGAEIRLSPVKVSPAMGLLPYDENSVVDFLTRRHRLESGKLEGDIVNVELAVNIYKAGICLDLVRLGREERLNKENGVNRVSFVDLVDDEERMRRLSLLLGAIADFSDYSKQARLLTDFTPDLIIASAQSNYSHRLQKALYLDEDCSLNTELLKQVLEEVKRDSVAIFAGILEGVIANMEEVNDILQREGVELKSNPREALESLNQFIAQNEGR